MLIRSRHFRQDINSRQSSTLPTSLVIVTSRPTLEPIESQVFLKNTKFKNQKIKRGRRREREDALGCWASSSNFLIPIVNEEVEVERRTTSQCQQPAPIGQRSLPALSKRPSMFIVSSDTEDNNTGLLFHDRRDGQFCFVKHYSEPLQANVRDN